MYFIIKEGLMKKSLVILMIIMMTLTGCAQKERKSTRLQKEFYSMSDEWTVKDKWKLGLNEIYETDERSTYRNENNEEIDFDYDNVYILNYSYENLRQDETVDVLNMKVKNIVADNGEEAFNYPLEGLKRPKDLKSLEKCDEAEYAFAFKNRPEKIKIYFNKEDVNRDENEVTYEEVVYDLEFK